MSEPFFCHWYASGAVPLATTVKVAVWPAVTVCAEGCVVIVGATGAEFTVKVACALVTLLTLLLTITSNLALLSALVVAGVV